MCNASYWQLFFQRENNQYNEKRSQEDIAKIRPRLWIFSRTELHPLAAGDFDEYYVELKERYQRSSLSQLHYLFDLQPRGP